MKIILPDQHKICLPMHSTHAQKNANTLRICWLMCNLQGVFDFWQISQLRGLCTIRLSDLTLVVSTQPFPAHTLPLKVFLSLLLVSQMIEYDTP